MWTNLFLLACLAIQIYFTIRSIITWGNAGKSYKAYITKFSEELIRATEVWKDGHIERTNLLSRENGRLIEENQMLRDKLKNLGFSDISLKQ